jgi:hypothetical protein
MPMEFTTDHVRPLTETETQAIYGGAPAGCGCVTQAEIDGAMGWAVAMYAWNNLL